MAGASRLVHATCIAVDGRGALLLGPSGSGKSDLALRAISGTWRDGGRLLRAELVADDQVLIEPAGGSLIARAPASIAGRLEVRGLGILEVATLAEVRLGLAVALVGAAEVERLADPAPTHAILGQQFPLLRLAPFEASAALKLVLALARLPGLAVPGR